MKNKKVPQRTYSTTLIAADQAIDWSALCEALAQQFLSEYLINNKGDNDNE